MNTKLNQTALRAAFWEQNPQFKRQKIKGRYKTQNEYSCDVRSSFVEFVDAMHRAGEISDKVANNVTLK